ncbi:MAG: hypoxanthine phosphoribosyltransferase [Prolixibacteraceae bacterium]|nr:hypoxanthine phosphoribosyltransferase [Prolixibacteraceae bacterium]
MTNVKIFDKEFRLYIPKTKIFSAEERIAEDINIKFKGKNPLFISILKGSFMFATEVFKRITLNDAEISFVRLSSYSGISSTGKVKSIIGLNENIEGRHIIILEDIIETGITIKKSIDLLKLKKPSDIYVATLLLKPDKLQTPIKIDNAGFKISNNFIIGHGLDYNQRGRNFTDIYQEI